MTIGHPELVAAIASEIHSSGPIPFVRFMELALYHPQFGYYMRPPDSGTERIGWSGDYYTSADVHSILGQALAKQARQLDALVGSPNPFTVVEMGPGKGLLAKHFLSACRTHADNSFNQRLRYVLIERSPAMRERQGANLLHGLCEPGRITWVESLDSLAAKSVVGLLFSNELPDAFPVHRLHIERGQTQEVYVDYDGDRFVECLRPLSSPEIHDHLMRLNLSLPDGYCSEVNLEAIRWMTQVARTIDRGLSITIDYGHTAHDLYGPDHAKGTFLCYYSQMTSEDPYIRIGQQDMTSHIDFSSLATVGEAHGLHVTGFTNQMSFLMGLGAEEMIAALEPESREFHAALQLLRPNGMGGTFKVLVQHKGIPHPELDSLKFKPFFSEALMRAESHICRS